MDGRNYHGLISGIYCLTFSICHPNKLGFQGSHDLLSKTYSLHKESLGAVLFVITVMFIIDSLVTW